ncbi:hypothetical protein Ddc_20883 [Ditylenchus destructor]|nr:hypothetical protein Ddc_20883 [Ditylenchus destructor]
MPSRSRQLLPNVMQSLEWLRQCQPEIYVFPIGDMFIAEIHLEDNVIYGHSMKNRRRARTSAVKVLLAMIGSKGNTCRQELHQVNILHQGLHITTLPHAMLSNYVFYMSLPMVFTDIFLSSSNYLVMDSIECLNVFLLSFHHAMHLSRTNITQCNVKNI